MDPSYAPHIFRVDLLVEYDVPMVELALGLLTEYGVVKLRGLSLRRRALALISIAHPDFRDQLRHAARQMKII